MVDPTEKSLHKILHELTSSFACNELRNICAPDPTAGGSLQEVAAWYLDEAGVREQLRAELTNLANNATLVGGLYGGDNNSPPNIRLPSVGGGGGGQSGAQLSASAPPSGVMQQRSNNSHRPHPNSSSSLDNNNNNNSRVVNNRNQSDTDHTSSPPPPSEEVGLDWLLRYRRLTTSHQNLFIGSTTCTNPYTTFNDFDFASSSSSNHAPGSYDESCLHSESSMSNNNNNSSNRLYYSTSPFHLLSNSFDIDPNVHSNNNNSNVNTTNTTTTATGSSSMQSSGTQIAAMFAKVRELLAKRDSNAPRLLSLITEELLNCSKLPPLKSRRNIRNSGINMANRSQTIPPVIRLPHSQLLQTSDRNYSSENLSNSSSSAPSPSSNHNSSHSLFSQPPPWTVRLWEEVCLLWTLVLLSPDCNAEMKKQWRCRLQNWSRVSRSPCDDCYLLPNHYFSSIHELSEVNEDGLCQNQQQQPPTSRAYRRTSVFRLPIEVSYMSWDEVWLTHLLSFNNNNNNNNMKSDKNEEELNETSVNRQSHYSTNISLDDNNNNKHSPGAGGAGGGGECHCPYCDLSATLTEPFPLLCLRVAALRSNGYLSQALQLAVFISQRLLRSVKAKTALATSTLFNMGMRSPPQTFSPHMSWSNNNHNSNNNNSNNNNNGNNNNNNNNYPNDILTARRTLFNTPPNNGQGIRVGGGMHSNSRYIPSASLSPPINVNHHSRSIPPPPPPPLPAPRRLGLSPNSNHSPGPSCSNHQPVNNNNNCCWSSQSPYLFKSPPPPPPSAPSTSQQYLNHCSPSASAPSASSSSSSSSSGSSPFSPVPFHNSYHHHQQQQQQSSNTNHVYYYYNKQHMPYPNSSLYPYASSCSLPPPMHNSNCGSNGNSTAAAAVMHPVHYNRSLTSPTSPCPPPPPPGNRSIPSRPLLSPHSMPSGGGGGASGETDMNCGLISSNCPCHADIGWIGLPGRPVICLVECLLDAAAIVVEAAASHHHHQTPIALPSSWGHMEKASFYLCLAVKVSLLALFQQRPPVGSVSRLLACQHQEARLLTLLNTIPKDVTIALAMCDILCQLLGPPISPSRILCKLDHSPVVRLWWWSALGFLVHPDTYPVHAVAEFVLNYLLDTQRLNQLTSFTTCWSGFANGNNNMSSVRIDDMVFTLVIRAMRFSIPENYMDNPGTGPGLMRSNSSPQLSMGGGVSGGGGGPTNGGSQRTHYHRGGWGDHFNNNNNNNNLAGSSSAAAAAGGNVVLLPGVVRSGLDTALAVNTDDDEVNDQEFPSMSMTTTTTTTPISITTSTSSSVDSNSNFMNNPVHFDYHYQRFPHLPTTNPLLRWEHHQQQQHQQQHQSAPDGVGGGGGGDRFVMTAPKISSPPLPSAFAISTQNFLKTLSGSVNMNSSPNSSSSGCRNLCHHQHHHHHPVYNLQNAVDNRWSTPIIIPSIDHHHHDGGGDCGGGEVTPFSGLAPLFTIMRNNIRIRRNRFSTIIDDSQTINGGGNGNGIVSPQNQSAAQCRRCLDTLKIRQSRLAVALIRVSKSLVNRLDQIVQICDQNIHSPVTLLVISQQVFAEAFGWKLRTPLDRKAGASDNNLHDIAYNGCPCSSTQPPLHNLISTTNSTNPPSAPPAPFEVFFTRDRIHLLCTAFHLTLLAMIRTLSRSFHWRRQEMLKWAVAIALHVGPFACLYLINHWSSYVNAREAVIWLAPAILTAMGNLNSKVLTVDPSNPSSSSPFLEDDMCFDHSLFCGSSNCNGGSSSNNNNAGGGNIIMTSSLDDDRNCSAWNHTISISTAAQLLGTAIPYSKASREQITNAVRHMAIQAAAKDPVSCSLPALHFSEEDSSAFETVYRLVLDAAEAGSIGPIQLFSLARYMDSHGWVWRAFPLALHATRLFVLSSTQEGHPVANDVLWACLLGHRLGPVALQEILKNVIHNIHCPTLLTDILHRCRTIPYGMNSMPPPPPPPVNSNVNHHHQHYPINNINNNNNNFCYCCCNNISSNNINIGNNSNGTNNHNNSNSNNYVHSSTIDPCVLMNNTHPTNSMPIGRNPCTTHFCNASHYINNTTTTIIIMLITTAVHLSSSSCICMIKLSIKSLILYLLEEHITSQKHQTHTRM
ncbi:unnamed protein product [Trichobilharzia szidati]|nr:unnamed protein product [Trichobilharzia szidati]